MKDFLWVLFGSRRPTKEGSPNRKSQVVDPIQVIF